MLSAIKTLLAHPLETLRFIRATQDINSGGSMTLDELRREPVRFELDIDYADTGNPRHQLDIYLPRRRRKKPLPVIVFIHGGGWILGDKSDGAERLMPYVRSRRFAGISIGYRLADEAHWPEQLYDGKAAIRWIRAHAEQYNLDADRIAVCGRSAGGHLALMLGTSCDQPELEGNIGRFCDASSKVAAVINYFGVTDIQALIGQPGNIDRCHDNAPEAHLIGGNIIDRPAIARSASPVVYAHAAAAPVLTVHGTDDQTVPFDQAVRIHKALSDAGSVSYFIVIRGGGHENFGNIADSRVQAFLEKHLLGKKRRINCSDIDFTD